jgi:RNA polymerase sigma-70 factor (ECF subfamily)
MVSSVGRPGEEQDTRASGSDPDGAWMDTDILEGVRRRESKALEAFFDIAFPYVYNLAFRLMGNREVAEDVAQDVFLKVYQAADRLQVDRHPKPWLTAITYNACRDKARRASVRAEVPEDAALIGGQPDGASTPENVVLRKERERLTEKALMELDEESRAVIILHDFCDTTHEEIAKIMEISHAAVRKKYSRALKRMAAVIKGLQ